MRFLVPLFGLLVLAGCAGPSATAPEGEAEPAFVKQITTPPVTGRDGQPYGHPFLGGFNVPRPQLVDIDGDGDDDLFVQETSGQVMFFEQTGTEGDPQFTWRTDQFAGLDVGEWYRFVDLDDDGDPDLLAESPYSYIRYYRNVGTPEAPRFTVAADTLRDVEGEPIFADRQNILNVADIDCDGHPDLFIGRVEGTVRRYESVGMEDGIPQFKYLTDRFEDIEIVGQIGTLHGANTLVFADADGDGDVDLFWGDYFEPGLLLIENTGTCTSPMLRNPPQAYPPGDPVSTSGYNAPALGDVDLDGDTDLLVGVLGGAFNANTTLATNFLYYQHQDDGTYALQTRRFLGAIDLGSETTPAFADLDADGDDDLLVGIKIAPDNPQTARLYQFENTGTATDPAFHLADSVDLHDAYHYAPALGDLDADGDPDLLVGTWNGEIALYRNTGTPEAPTFEPGNLLYLELTRGGNAVPALGDLDADGDLDLIVGESSGTLNYYRNDGTPAEARFVLQSDAYLDLDVGRRSTPALADVDGDGDLDLLVGREEGPVTLYRNTGTPEAPAFSTEGTRYLTPVASMPTPALTDLDGDGDLDLVSGSLGGGLVYYEQR